MNCDCPAPALRFSRREARVVVPALIEEFGGAVGQSAPRQRRDCVDDDSKLIFRFFDFDERLFQSSVRMVLLGDVHHRADILQLPRIISHGMRHDVDVLDRSIRQEESMFEIQIHSVLNSEIESLSYEDDVFRMNPLKHQFERWLSR